MDARGGRWIVHKHPTLYAISPILKPAIYADIYQKLQSSDHLFLNLLGKTEKMIKNNSIFSDKITDICIISTINFICLHILTTLLFYSWFHKYKII